MHVLMIDSFQKRLRPLTLPVRPLQNLFSLDSVIYLIRQGGPLTAAEWVPQIAHNDRSKELCKALPVCPKDGLVMDV